MPFTIYPDAATAALLGAPANSPVHLASGAGFVTINPAMNGFVPLAGRVGPDPGAFGLNTTFIRISMSGATSGVPPQVELKAVNPVAATEGGAVSITATSIGAAQGLLDGTNGTGAASAYFFPPHANNVYLLKVVINILGTTLKIKVTNNTGAARDFVWVVADSGPDSRQPWIHVHDPRLVAGGVLPSATPAIFAYNALINQSASLTTLSVGIANRGTGPLTVTSTTPVLPAADFTLSGLPATVAANAPAASIPVTFRAPAAAGELPSATFAFDGDGGPTFGAGHNREISLSAKTQALEIALLLDDSGSMSWEPDADPIPPAAGPSRWSSLVTAANQFLDLLAVFGRNNATNSSMGTFGVARFPTTNPANPATYDIVPPASIPSSMGTAQTAISAVTPFFAGTPMGDGINRVLTPGAHFFSTDPAVVNLNRRWILLMTDGAENSSTVDSLSFIALAFGGTAAPGNSLADKKIKVFSVGYGVQGKAEVNYPRLEQIAAGSFEGGDKRQVEASGLSSPALAAAFRAAIKSGLVSASSPTDPGGTLTSRAAEARHRVIITPYDTKIAFVLNWHTENAQRMRLHLLTPTCDLITPESAGDDFGAGDIGFNGASRYQIYRIEESYLRNAADPANPRHGTWTMVVFSDELASTEGGEDSEYYEYDVIVESRLQMDVRLDHAVYYAGDTIGLSAILTLDGKPITHAAVTLSLTAPGQAVNNWLAAVKISAAEYRHAEEEVLQLTKNDANALFIKAFAAQRKEIFFEAITHALALPMTDPENRGVYSANFSQTATPDDYKLYVTAVGITEDGVVFRREREVHVGVGVRPDPKFTLFDIKYYRTAEGNFSEIRVIPLDRFGNVVLVDPAIDPRIVLTAKGGEFAGPLLGNLDGSYTRTLRYSPDATPTIGLEVAGQTIVGAHPLVPVAGLQYVDRVDEFKPGGEAVQGTNQHADPKAALGSVLGKAPDTFVALGAYGSLAVSIQGQSILAQGDDDITVFVRQDADLRPYFVEALRVGKQDWVLLGNSAGITQSFGLAPAGLQAAGAIRITDTSGRTRDSDFNPTDAPGVCVTSVGVKKVGGASAGCQCCQCCLGMLKNFCCWIRQWLGSLSRS